MDISLFTSFFIIGIFNANAYPEPENVIEIESSYKVRYSCACSWQCDGSNEQGYENYVRQGGCNLKIERFFNSEMINIHTKETLPNESIPLYKIIATQIHMIVNDRATFQLIQPISSIPLVGSITKYLQILNFYHILEL